MFAIQSTTDSCIANLGDVPKNIDVPDVEGSDSTTGTFTSVVSSQKSHYAPKHGMDSVESSRSTDSLDDLVCVVGLACHLPGDVRSLFSLWELLVNKRSVQGPVPPERFNIKGFHGPDDSRAGIMSADGGYFLKEDVRLFENSFFGINNLEALYMDPLQRKLLEAVFECFENAGVSLEQMAGSNTGVYTGDFTCDYQTMHYRDPDYLHRYSATGSGKAILANRISNIFNLQGPSLTMNTACSSALYCLHTAVSAIKAGDCDGAIVAAANLIMSPEQHIEIMKGGVLSPTSTCHTFDISADGYGRGEGVEAVYIKRLSSALKDNDKIWGVIRATSLNACGKTPGISQPSAALQEAVIRKAYANAALDFCDTDYVECHGTGTAVGDVIEVEALKQCFSPRESPLMIGSVKTNLGHSESTSGLTSLLKVLLAFENGRIPPTFGVSKLNPKLPLESSNFKVVTEAEQWPRSLRRASINSFGYGGANAHVIVEALDSYLGSETVRPLPIPKCNDQLLVLPVSAVSSRSLQTRIDQVVALVGCSNATYLMNLTFTLTDRRSHLRSKASLLVRASDDGGSEVIETQLSEPPKLNPSGSLPFAFVFTGQGAQYACMAKELLLHNTIFSATIQELDNVLQVLPSEHRPAWTLRQAILDPPGIGLVKVLKSWGVCASAVVGHSSGEIAAAYAAGLLGQSEAIIVAYMRGYSVAQLKAHGSMAAAGIDVQSAEQIIDKRGLKGDVCVACVNSPTSVTLSGSLRGIEVILSELQNQKKFCRKLETGGRAYHSHMMREIGSYYETLITPYVNGKWDKLANSDTQMYSSVGYSGDNPSILNLGTNNARYWRDNLETPVQFNSALLKLAASGDFYFIEIGPHHALKGPVQQTLATMSGPNKRSLPYSPSLIRNEDSNIALKRLAGSLFSHGYELNWGNINNLPRSIALRPLPDLPPYPWDYSAGLLWHEPRASTELRNRKYVRHELLGSQQLAGNGIDWSWRNVLRLNEVPWLRDHKVESQVIFPASGYLAMAIEAISQILGLKDRSPHDKPVSFEIRNVNIRTAFVVQSEDGLDADANQVELHTTMSPRKISMTTTSANWYDFSISSWTSEHTTVHCAGNIRANGSVEPKSTVPISNSIDHNIPMKRWYKRFEEEGLRYGPQFRSLVKLCTDGTKNRPDAVSTVRLVPPAAHTSYTEYGMHPITIDACFQTAIFGITGGKPSSLRAYLPVSISECWIQAVQVKTPQSEAHIYTRAARTSIATQKADCTLRVAGDSLINLRGVRLSLYTGKMDSSHSSETATQRNPCLRVHWKPDILRLHPGVEDWFKEYVKGRMKRIQTDMADDKTLAIGVLLELAGHKSPGMRVLELGRCCDAKAKIWLDLLNSDKAFPRCGTWQAGTPLKDGELVIEDGDEGPFDVVLVPDYAASERCFGRDSKKNALSMVADHGIIISHKTDKALGTLSAANFATLHVGDEIVLATRTAKIPSLKGVRDVVIIFQELTPHVEELISSIKSTLKMATGVAQVSHVSLSEVHTVKIHEKTICISLLEFETEFLATMNQDKMDLLRSVTNVVTDLLWVTGGDMLSLTGQADPNLVLAQGLSRALMLEQPSLRFSVVDIGHARHSKQDMQPVCENLLRTLVPLYDMDDKEFIYTEGLLYISRFGPDTALNSQFRRRLGMEERLHQETLGSAGLARFSVGMAGRPDTIYFQKLCEHRTELSSGLVDVAVKAVGLNAKDIYTLGGHLETRMGTEACEFTGVVREVAKDVTHVQPGDRVMVLWPNHFATIERVPSWAVHKLLPDEEFTTMAAIPVVYSTALYALNDRAHLRKGESILVHAGSGALGVALIGLAQSAGAVVFATVGSQAKRDFLMAEFGLPASHIFSSRDPSFVAGVMEMTKGRGVDILINSLIGDLMHGSWECVANFGRFVEVGKRELLNAGRLDMQGFLRNATFTAFDLEDMILSDDPFLQDIVSSKVKEALKWYRSRHIKLPPVTTFDIADISQAYRYFSTKDRVGKVAVSLENPESKIQVCEPNYSTLLDPEKSYLLVGCLGGLGRSLSRWMFSRGARNFVFLGRSGFDKLDAQKLVSGLRNAGASVVVVKGDVTIASDVTAAVKACTVTGRRIGGVVQGTMALREAIFSQMTSEAWHIGVDCKWAGTWNLHHALEDYDGSLDFFLMTSSNSGSVGVATEANYCASNTFLDSFARWRRSQGKTAVSVGIGMISEVGYLHENPDIQAILIRRGVQGMSEDEFLQLIDFAISGKHNNSDVQGIDDLAAAHILSGMESTGFRKLLAQGFDVSNLPMQDPRSRMLAESLALELRVLAARGEVGKMGKFADGTSKAALESDAKAMIAMTSASSRREAILQLVRKQFSNMILVPAEQIDDHKPMAQFGVDSMLAAEFRTWFWITFEVDVSFLDLRSERKSLDSIASVVEAKFAESANSNAGSK
ncbi:polyketide synthase-like protein [Annulohypoxylon truncatum]|uniref:polyketide synthase-like protein n=1 Tax=Annulohypoxylon truncatum TaxID=327061 RepID=UPI0020081EC1|nr:polyketide synthase-like protein [Annulohypoxylon truncatum]KAI1207269.1 polyketide synthase-like protein [Annulohypoxylon truncatum]